MIGKLNRLRKDTRAVAATEFALVSPLLLTAGLWGLESAYLAITHMKVSQVAMQVADNASRIGDTSMLQDRRIYESDINDLLYGSNLQAGPDLDIYEHGRIIISSLQVEPGSDPDQQYIEWQRCKGKKSHTSSYGIEGEGKGDPSFVGMGPSGKEIFAVSENEAVMFVEVAYDYQPLVSSVFVDSKAMTISVYAAFNVRDDRDLSQIYQEDALSPDPVSACNVYDDYPDDVFPSGTGGGSSTTTGGSTTTSGGSTSTSSGGSGSSGGASSGGASSGGASSGGKGGPKK